MQDQSSASTAGALVVVGEPSHEQLLTWDKALGAAGSSNWRSRSIITARHEFQIASVAQLLKLLSDFVLYVSVVGIKVAEDSLERVNVFKLELLSSNCFNAPHNLNKPASSFNALLP